MFDRILMNIIWVICRYWLMWFGKCDGHFERGGSYSSCYSDRPSNRFICLGLPSTASARCYLKFAVDYAWWKVVALSFLGLCSRLVCPPCGATVLASDWALSTQSAKSLQRFYPLLLLRPSGWNCCSNQSTNQRADSDSKSHWLPTAQARCQSSACESNFDFSSSNYCCSMRAG